MAVKTQSNPMRHALYLRVDAGVKARAKESTRIDRSGLLWFASYVLPVFFPAVVFLGMVLTWHLNGSDFLDYLSLNGIRLPATVLVVGATLIIIRNSYVRSADNPSTHLIIKHEIRVQIREAKRAAKLVGTSVLPVLTIEHVDARARVEEALIQQHLHDGPLVWNQTDADKITALLFEDLNREHTILSLIVDRRMFTHAEISKALAGMEANGKALQEGWL